VNRRTFLKAVPAGVLIVAVPALARAATASTQAPSDAAPAATQGASTASAPALSLKPIDLLKPQMEGGKSVLAALKERKTIRAISDKALPPQVLSNLLWAAFGVNRDKGSGGQVWRTAASASNSQEIDLYVALPEGVYLYEAVPHRLSPVYEGDLRAKAGRGRGGAAKAPVNILFVADIAKFGKARFQEPGLKDAEIQKSYYNIDAGLIAGNVYLFAASQDLAAWFHNCDKAGLAKELQLRPDQRVLYAQTVGYPA
jgi:hypothetical protein